MIFALDVDRRPEALAWVERLSGAVGAFKVGLELFVSEGPGLVQELVARGERVFLDLKFHDIPATVAGACRAAGRLGAFLVNVHALAGPDALARAAEAAREGAREAGRPAPRVIAVTVLTSHSARDLERLGLSGPPGEAVLRLAALARDAGLDGIVASPLEAERLRRLWPGAVIVTPGVRPAGADAGDQVRVATPAGAVTAGADYLVVGRPIRDATNPRAAAQAIGLEVARALSAPG
ncbi:MAG: orotidine-5'-phosphate decarboxylase [Deltaproteobacteria bacterium]|nr:orotidine-5'-phosphate decarboxylase [Deltaproteobacteria bacterium]